MEFFTSQQLIDVHIYIYIKIYIYIYIYSIIRMCVSMAACIAEGRLAPANGRNPGCEQLLFALSWSQKWCQKPAPKTGPQYCRKKERLPKWQPRFWDQGVAYTVSPPLRAVSSEDSGTFRFFPGNGLDKASSKFHSIYIYG